MPEVTVAIPVRDGGELLREVLRALSAQTVAHELIVCDSGSRDGSVAIAREHGARLLEIPPHEFSHGATRNLLVSESTGAYVALLTQDAAPASELWLERLLDGLALAADAGLAYGPYAPRSGAAAPVRLELERWFGSLSPDGAPRVDRLAPSERALPAVELLGRRGFFTDVNACISREAWLAAPFRAVPYAEDRVLAIDMLRAGFAKVFVPGAAVTHSHDYGTLAQFRRSFDEGRAVREVYGWREPLGPRRLLGQLRGELGYARDRLAASGTRPGARAATLAAVGRHHLARLAGAILGSRADRLPARARRLFSLERRGSFLPCRLDPVPTPDPPRR